MKKVISLIVVVGAMNIANAQWQLVQIPDFNWNPNCDYSFRGEVASDSTYYWMISEIYGSGSQFTNHDYMYKTTNGGTSWQYKYSASFPNSLSSMEFISPDSGYYIVYNGFEGGDNLHRTSDGMNSYQLCQYTTWHEFYSINILDINDLYALGPQSTVQHLENDTFKITGTLPGSGYYGFMKVTKDHSIYMSNRSPSFDLIYKSEDNGETWDSSAINPNTPLRAIQFYSDNLGFAVGDSGRIFKTTDAGQNWILKETGVTQSLYSLDFLTENTWIAAGDSGIIIWTNDCGETWDILPSPTSSTLIKLKLPEKDGNIFVYSSYQYGYQNIWKADLFALTTHSENCRYSYIFELIPNPAHEKITVIPSDFKSGLHLSIFNINGTKVIDQKLYTGDNQVNISSLPQGIYIVSLKNDRDVQVVKLIKE